MPFTPPPAVVPGATVRVIAPAGPFDRASFEVGLAKIKARYQVEHRPDLFSGERYLAGSDERRLEELVEAFSDDSQAVFCARGGYGVMRLLERIPVGLLKQKPLVGFSDITALHLAFQAKGRVTVHGPVLTQLGKQPDFVLDRLFRLLEQPAPAEPLEATTTLVPGLAEGPLIGGNLSVLTRLLGTPFLPELKGAVLLLEDVGERPYRLDRMWTHLKLADVFTKVAGIALGEFTGCDEKDAPFGGADILRDLARETGLPCAAGFRIGHGEVNVPVPLGTKVRLDATARQLTFLEPAVAAR